MTVPVAGEPERREKKQSLLATFGPGLITGASDNDPSRHGGGGEPETAAYGPL